jgi:predicted DNA-binding transcriptional regulator AlpA
MNRITTSEVCALGRFSRATLWRRIASGALPPPIDHAREAIFDRDRVMAALAIRRPRWRKPTPAPEMPKRSARAVSTSRKTQRQWSAQRWELAK